MASTFEGIFWICDSNDREPGRKGRGALGKIHKRPFLLRQRKPYLTGSPPSRHQHRYDKECRYPDYKALCEKGKPSFRCVKNEAPAGKSPMVSSCLIRGTTAKRRNRS